jgi:hypothetical protein
MTILGWLRISGIRRVRISGTHIRLSSTGIEVTYFEKAEVVYYWNTKHKKIETIQIGD